MIHTDILRSPAQVYKLCTTLGFGLNFYLVKKKKSIVPLYGDATVPCTYISLWDHSLGAVGWVGASWHRLVTADSSCPFPSSHSVMTHWWHETGGSICPHRARKTLRTELCPREQGYSIPSTPLLSQGCSLIGITPSFKHLNPTGISKTF